MKDVSNNSVQIANRIAILALLISIAALLFSAAALSKARNNKFLNDTFETKADIDISTMDSAVIDNTTESIEVITNADATIRVADATTESYGDDSAFYEMSPIELSSAEDLYALGRLLQSDSVKRDFITKDASYNIDDDFDNFKYPFENLNSAEKIAYLQTASYILTNDVQLIVQKTTGKNYFTGVGSTSLPFMGTFNGNGKTITLTAISDIDIGNASDFGTGLFDTTENAKISNFILNVENDIIVTSAKGGAYIGLVVGKAISTEVNACTVYISGARVGAVYSENQTSLTSIGGIAGESTFSIYNNCQVVLKNAVLIGKSKTLTLSRRYSGISVGGILGFSGAGSSNTENIGALGNQLYNCSFTVQNDTKQDAIAAYIETGNEITVGGIVGCTFNNIVVKNCSVNIKNGNIVAAKTGAQDTAEFGTQAGGIIGRLEHTGEVYNCNVFGDNLTILSKSPNNLSNAGGIVGVDMGPYHRDVISINKCAFDGSNTSVIQLEITSSDTLTKAKILAVGGIVGTGSYIISDCSVKNATIVNQSGNIGNPVSFIGEICGYKSPAKDAIDATGKTNTWQYGTYFTPRTPAISNCSVANVTMIQSDNVQNLSYAIK